MTKNIEVEFSGPLTVAEKNRLETLFKKDGKEKMTKHRVLIDYSTFLGDGLKNREEDIRLRITNGKPEIIIKLGAFKSANHRKELSVFTEAGSFDTLVQIFATLGFKKGMLCERTTRVFDYKGAEFALVEIPNHSFHFEAEIMSEEDDIKNSEEKLRDICHDLGLKIFTDKEYVEYIEKLNREANEVFDFENYIEGYFENRYHFNEETKII